MLENKYSYLVGTFRRPTTSIYQDSSPESSFEDTVQTLFNEAQAHLQHREYNLALSAFRELMSLILYTAHPQIPIDPNRFHFDFPTDLGLIDVLSAKSAAVLKAMPVLKYDLPTTIASPVSVLPAEISAQLAGAGRAGVQVTSFHAGVEQSLGAALASVDAEDWKGALVQYQTALDATPATETIVRGALLQDMAVISEKSGDQAGAVKLAQQTIDTLANATQLDVKVLALDTATGIVRRAGNADLATKFAEQAGQIRSTTNLNPVVAKASATPVSSSAITRLNSVSLRNNVLVSDGGGRLGLAADAAAGAGALATTTADSVVLAPTLIASQVLSQAVPVKSFLAQGLSETAEIVLDANAAANTRAFLTKLSVTADVGLLTRYLTDPVQMVAYLPHMYFFVIPMSMGDCLAGMGDLDAAITQYRSVLTYPFINQNVEIVRLWTRLAQAYLDQGDAAYRNARDDVSQFDAARTAYENIVVLEKKVIATSPLYADAKFASILTRVRAFLDAPDQAAHDDNPAVTAIVLQALGRIEQIEQGLNFFGFGIDYSPPFSFEYLQNTARYFGQQASQIEQRFIQFQSQAENDELQRDQMDQQAEVARQSVVLEQRGVDEAQRGVAVAQASANYATTQLSNAQLAQQDFQDNRWELLELTEAEAWASASSVDHDDEVKLTWNGNYYNSSKKNRNQVLQDLASQRARLSQDLESKKLDREITSAQSYLEVAQAQQKQAQARVAVAQQRVVVAQLQQKYAEQNRDFLDLREFGAQLWYDLARQAERIKQRYLDMATEIAFLTERAYNAETERGLHVVQYDYQHTASGNLMGADQLLVDIDYFTFDHVTTTKTKKLPVKTTISLADSYPMQFQTLKNAGKCLFETALEDFDRAYPGLYLAKVRNVELVFVGITQATSVAGTLRNVGVSRFRSSDGTVVERLYPADVMALSQFDLRQDALAFPVSPNDLKLFENNGIATSWQLDMPLSANDFDFADILDVHLVLYYDGFFDPLLETQIRAALPAAGSASRAFTLAMSFPDELFWLKNQGQAELVFDKTMFPHSQKDLVRSRTVFKLTGDAQAVQNVTIQLTADAVGATPITLKTDAGGEVDDSVAGSALAALRGKPMLDRLKLTITAAANPQLVKDGQLDLSGLNDVLLFAEYGFTYR
ncbi:MAG: tetratricopeptide repeat protein [Pseudonocardiales bacterium]|nr:tetratricopeptide repeat protein [Pseudonocardiales bacterium]